MLGLATLKAMEKLKDEIKEYSDLSEQSQNQNRLANLENPLKRSPPTKISNRRLKQIKYEKISSDSKEQSEVDDEINYD